MVYVFLYALLATYSLWVFYLAVMNLKRAHSHKLLNKTALVLAVPVLVVGYFLDILVNVFIMSVLFLELPEEITVTARLKRHNRCGSGWRQRLARWFEPLLDPHDPSGDHI